MTFDLVYKRRVWHGQRPIENQQFLSDGSERSMGDPLYCSFNARGRKQFKELGRSALAETYPEYADVGLPAHKAALRGDVEGLKEIFACNRDDGVPSRDVNGATPLHLAVRNNRVETVK